MEKAITKRDVSIWFCRVVALVGIGTELAAEGEGGAPMQSVADLKTLLLRCAGLWLFLSASVTVGMWVFTLGYEQFFASSSSLKMDVSDLIPFTISAFLQSVLGFALAFTPRIRSFFRA